MEINRHRVEIEPSPEKQSVISEEDQNTVDLPVELKREKEEDKQVKEKNSLDEKRMNEAAKAPKPSTPSTTVENSVASQTEVGGQDLDCSIAVGLYVEEKNLDKMMGRLRTAGYSAVSVPLRRSTKVAIKIPCSTQQSQKILREIRANYASDAFIE